MMKEKILNVKNILKIILILFILFNMAKSCSYANSISYTKLETYNYNGDIMDFFRQCFKLCTGYDYIEDEVPYRTGNATNMQTLLDYLAQDEKQIIQFYFQTFTGTNYTTNDNNYMSIRLSKALNSGNGSWVTNIYYNPSQSYVGVSSLNWGSTSITFDGVVSTSNIPSNKFLIDKNNSNVRANQLWYKSTENTTNIQANLEFRPLYDYIKTISNKQFLVSEWTLGFSYIELGELINWENVTNLKGEIYKWTSNTSYEYIGDIRILVDGRTQIQTNNIYYNQGYLIRFTYNENDSTGYYNYYFVPYGGNSGDFSGELIYQPDDPNQYKPITNTINENNDMWQEIYNGLFTMDSGDIQQLKNRISGELMEMVDGKSDYKEEYELLENLQNTSPEDFIIKWNSVVYQNQNFIPSGEINFNSIVTEWRLTETHRVLRIILVGALAFIGAKAVWKCITITLGIGMEMYDDYEEENQTIETEHETYDTSTNMITKSITRRKGNKSNTIVGRRKK